MARIDIIFNDPWCLVGTVVVVQWSKDNIPQPYVILNQDTCPYNTTVKALEQIPHTADDIIYINGVLYSGTPEPPTTTSTVAPKSSLPLVAVGLIAAAVTIVIIRRK